MKNTKSSYVLLEALKLINGNKQTYACAAIQDVETTLRYANNGRDVKTNATSIFAKYRPSDIPDNMKASQGWWPKGSALRVEALEKAIEFAKKKGD